MATRSTACTHPNPNPNPGRRIRTVALLKLCTSMSEVHQAHAGIIKVGLAHDISAVNAIIEIAAVSDSGRNLLYAQSIFERTPNPTQFAKNLLLRGHSQGQNPRAAISVYAQMLTHGFEINVFAFTFLLQAAARSLSAEEGKQIHGQILKSGENFDAHLATSALRFYSEIGDLNSARGVFEWNRRFVGSWNVMIDGYMKAGETDSARDLFDEMPHKTVISWTAMICGYAHSGRFKEAVDTFRAMQGAGIRPDGQTIVSLLPSVSRLGHLGLGKWVHSYIKSSGVELNPFLGSALIDMYAKCGSIEDAIAMFHKVGPARRNVVVWNAMIGGLAMHGRGTEALRLFNEMLMSGFRPTGVTFVGVLRACGQVGMVDEGMKYFSAMKTVYRIDPVMEHYGCVVDLLSRAGRLEEAEKLMNTKRKRGEPDVVILKILLAACKVRGNVVIGERVGRELLELAPGDSSCYVLLSNLYASVGLWENATRVRNLMKERGVEKIAGCSAIELDNEVHEFLAGDVSHPRIKEIYAKLEEIAQRLKLEGYRADTNVVLANIDEEEKETAVDRHSEKLAIAFGLINTESGGTIRIVKNLRVCVDCHAATKLISRIYDREIIARDQNRFHHFRKGSCSCNDYW